MKKYLLGLFAVVLALGFSAFTFQATTDFHFKPANGSNSAYIVSTSWEVQSSNPECTGGPDVCILRIPDTKLTTPVGGTPEQKLADYLSRQGLPGADFTSAAAAIAFYTLSKKP